MKKPKQKRPGSRLILTWIRTDLVRILDDFVRREDTDRSKFIRAAIREKIRRCARNHLPAPEREIPNYAPAIGAMTHGAVASNPTKSHGATAPTAPFSLSSSQS